MSDLKSRLLAKNRRVVSTFKIGDDTVAICKPTLGERAQLLKEAREAGEMNEKGENSNDPAKGVALQARLASFVVRDPISKARIFSSDEVPALLDEEWLAEHSKEIEKAFGSPTVEEAKGN